MPAPNIQKTKMHIAQLEYTPMWSGYALAESTFQLKNSTHQLKLIVHRQSEQSGNFSYMPFLTTSDQNPLEYLPIFFLRDGQKKSSLILKGTWAGIRPLLSILM